MHKEALHLPKRSFAPLRVGEDLGIYGGVHARDGAIVVSLPGVARLVELLREADLFVCVNKAPPDEPSSGFGKE